MPQSADNGLGGRALPDFIVLGCAKSGTTSLYHYLKGHPEVYMPGRKEPSFFAHEGETLDYKGPGDGEWSFITDLGAYRDMYTGATSGRSVVTYHRAISISKRHAKESSITHQTHGWSRC